MLLYATLSFVHRLLQGAQVFVIALHCQWHVATSTREQLWFSIYSSASASVQIFARQPELCQCQCFHDDLIGPPWGSGPGGMRAVPVFTVLSVSPFREQLYTQLYVEAHTSRQLSTGSAF
jgi:hypothetical protein